MSFDLILKPSCSGCGSSKDLYGSSCKHLTLCLSCGKNMAENHAKCFECGAAITRLIWEYNIRTSSSSEKNFFIGRFMTGLPNFSRKQNADNKCVFFFGDQNKVLGENNILTVGDRISATSNFGVFIQFLFLV